MSSRQVSDATHPVRLRRRERRLTQAELAQAVGVSRQTVIAVERGDYAPSVYLALRIAKVLGATVEDLFAEADESQEAGR
ncbi:helix-turn-helix transcriptional regulator [Georgenia sp. MJ173]|uniref:helix-turn-helix transcriptional regulator n=1 Tax=Georgenia sunbinii TaxID=3117728 RepID=UPI002F268FBB